MSFGEILIICVIALIFLKPEQIPEVAKTLGKFMREIRRATNEMNNAIQSEAAQLKDLHNSTKKDVREAVDIKLVGESLSLGSQEKIKEEKPKDGSGTTDNG